MLKYQLKKVVWEADLQDLIQVTYGRRTEWSAEQEMGQNETRDFTVPSTKYLWSGEQETFDRWLAGEDMADVSMQLILNDLHERGLVEAGEYVVEVYW